MNPLANQTHPYVYAQYYDLQGISCIPVPTRSKKTLIDWKEFQTRRATSTELMNWFADNAALNIGLVCGAISGNLCIVDFDSLEAFQTALGNEYLSKTLCVSTNRGIHAYFRTESPVPTQHYKLEGAQVGMDVIGEGGLAIAPPSIHESGKNYAIISDTLEIAKVTNLNFIINRVKLRAPLAGRKVTLRTKAAAGERNNTAFTLACRLRRALYSKEAATESLIAWNQHNQPPMDLQELMRTIESAFSRQTEATLESILHYFMDGMFVPARLAQELLSENHIIAPNGKELWYYDEIAGFYKPFEPLARKMAQERLGEMARKNRIEETIAFIKNQACKLDTELEPPKNLINLADGILDLDTFQIESHNPSYFFRGAMPVAYDEKATCPTIDAFLRQVIDADGAQVFYELAGYCLYRGYPIQKAIMFVGGGKNGKSTALRLLTAFLGADNVATVPLQDFARNRFAISALVDKLANICADLPADALRSTGTFKQLTGGDRLQAEKKFHDSLPFTNYAKLIFSANTVPFTKDETDAFFRRWLILTFSKVFEGENCDVTIIDKLTAPAELSGLLNQALEALPVVLERGEFTASKSTEELRKDYIRASEPISAFAMDCLEESPDNWESKDGVYEAYLLYCSEKKLSPADKTTFCKRLPTVLQLREVRQQVEGVRLHGWYGVKLVGGSINGG